MKYLAKSILKRIEQSPSTRREWIEIDWTDLRDASHASPSTRRGWIEIFVNVPMILSISSLSTRREWIEILAWRLLWS